MTAAALIPAKPVPRPAPAPANRQTTMVRRSCSEAPLPRHFDRSAVGGRDGVLHGIGKSALLERQNAFDRRSCRAAHAHFQHVRRFPTLQEHLRRAEHGLRRQTAGVRVRQARAHAAEGQCVRKLEAEGRPAARDGACGVDLRLRQGQQQPGLCQNGAEGVQLCVRHVLRGIEDRARADGCGRVRHDADERQSPAEHGVQLPERHGRRHADDDGCIPLPRLQHGSQLSCQPRQSLRLHAEKQQLGRFRSLRVRADCPAQLLCQRRGLGRGAVGKQQRVAALGRGPRQRAAHISGSDESDLHALTS